MRKTLLFVLILITGHFVSAQYLRGDFNTWSTDNLMSEYYSYYTTTIEVTADLTDAGFKVDQAGDWVTQWGYATDSYNPIVNTSEGQMRGSISGDVPGNFTKSFTAGKFYTFRLEGGATWWNRKFVIMETDAAPVNILAVYDNHEIQATDEVTVSITLNNALSAQETVYVRYTTDSWSSSDIVEATGTGTELVAIIPAMTAGTDVEYYVFSSAMVLSFVSTYPDFATLNGNNNGGLNYSYTVTSLTPYLSIATTANLVENTLDNSIISVELFNDTFADAVIDPTNILLNNAPLGLSVLSVIYIDDSNIEIVLDFDGTDFASDITNFSVDIDGAELAGGLGAASNDITIYAFVQKEGYNWCKVSFWTGGAEDLLIDATEFDTYDFGTLNADSSLYLKSGQANTWKITGGDILSATMNYRIYKSGDTPGSFMQQDLPWDSESVSNDTTYQLWWNNPPEETNLNILTSLIEGQYFIEVYFKIETTESNVIYFNNSGSNYIATFEWEDIPELIVTEQLEMNSSNLDAYVLDLQLINETFIDETPEIADFVLNNEPAGLTISELIYYDPEHVRIILAYAGGLIPTQIDNFSVTVLGTGLTGGAALQSNELTIYADQINEGIYLSKVSFWEGGASDTWYDETDFDGHDFGTFNSSMSLYFKSGQVFTWKNSLGDITAAKMNYRIYEESATPPAFTQVELPFYSEWTSGPNTDQLWWNDEEDLIDLNLLESAVPGTYKIEVYFEAINSESYTYYSNNDGANYIATFSYTDNPVLVATPVSSITEENLNGMVINLEINEDEFADAMLDEANFTLNNVPAGVTIEDLIFVGPTQATITLAFDGTDFDLDSAHFSITVAAEEFESAIELTSNQMLITAVDESITIYTHLLTAENFERTLGDNQMYWLNMEIGQEEWNGAQIGVGTNPTDPASFIWYDAVWYEDGEIPNKRVHSQVSIPNIAGVLYYAGRVRNTELGQWFYANNADWSDSNTLAAEFTFTTNELATPLSASTNMLDGTRIDVMWEKANPADNIMLLSSVNDPADTDPVQGVAYPLGTNLGNSVVIYKGNASGFLHTSLANNTTYHYSVFTINNNYYSEPVLTSGTTDDSEGCTFDLSLGDDVSLCGGTAIVLNSGLLMHPYADSLTVIFNSSSFFDFAEVEKVYMHSGVEITEGSPWDYTIGNWGEDDGVGLMTDLGGGMWMIKFNPLEYFGYNPDTEILGINLVFRNEDGTIIAQNPISEEDFYIDMSVNPPQASHNSILPLFQTSNINSVLWSNGATTPTISVTEDGEYSVIATDNLGCVAMDTIIVGVYALPYVELGTDQTLCADQTAILDAGDFESYLWSDDSENQTLTVEETGLYSVTVTDVNGCTGFDIVNISLVEYPVADFSYSVVSGTQVDFTDLSLYGETYAWDFNGDNVTDNTTSGNVSYTYPALGQYPVKLTVTNDCSSDIESKTIYVLNVEESKIVNIEIFPVPAVDFLFVECADSKIISVFVYDATGKLIDNICNKAENRIVLNTENYCSGLYNLVIETNRGIETQKILIK